MWRSHSTKCCFCVEDDRECGNTSGEWCLLVLSEATVHLRCDSCYREELNNATKMKSGRYLLIKREDVADWIRLRRLA